MIEDCSFHSLRGFENCFYRIELLHVISSMIGLPLKNKKAVIIILYCYFTSQKLPSN